MREISKQINLVKLKRREIDAGLVPIIFCPKDSEVVGFHFYFPLCT